LNQAEEKRNKDLLAAVQKNTIHETEELLRQGANPNVILPKVIVSRYVIRQPLFFWATLPNLRVLLAHGADPNLRSSNENTLLNHYCYDHVRTALHPEKDKIDMIRLLLDNHADPNLSSNDHDTPLHNVCRNSIDHIVIRLLLEKGAEPNLLNSNGMTPLHCIAENRFLGNTRYDIPFTQSIKLLIDAGADPTIRDEDDHTPSEHASLQGIPTPVVTALQHAERGLPLPAHPSQLVLPLHAPIVPAPNHPPYGNAQDPFNYQEAQNNQFGGGRRSRKNRHLTRKGKGKAKAKAKGATHRKHVKRTHRHPRHRRHHS